MLLLLVTAGAVGLAGALVYPYSGAAETNRTLRQAERFAVAMGMTLEKDARFNAVRVVPMVDGAAAVTVQGWVETDQDLKALQQVVEDARPPVKVRWAVQASDGAIPM